MPIACSTLFTINQKQLQNEVKNEQNKQMTNINELLTSFSVPTANSIIKKQTTFWQQFSDTKQREFVEVVADLNVRLSYQNFQYDQYNYYDSVTLKKINALSSISDKVLRFFQSIITEMGRVNRKKMDVIAGYIVWYVVKVSQLDSITKPPIEDIASLINLYMSQTAPTEYDYRITNICLILSTMGNWYPQDQLEVFFSKEVISFFINCLYNNPDKLTQLYTLVTLVFSATYDPIKLIFINSPALRLAVKLKSSSLRRFNPINLYLSKEGFNSIHFQIGSSAQWLIKNVYLDDGNDDSEEEEKDENKLNDDENKKNKDNESKYEQITVNDNPLELQTNNNIQHLKKVFANNLSAFGCCYSWQDYQCNKPANIASGHVYYFEAILLTTGKN